MNAQLLSSAEECVSDIGQRRRNDVAVKDAIIKLSMQECVGGTVQSSNYVAVKDAQI
jgi:hypothetical protein